ncbi:hypothetical protein [uncultured Maribacter sp.]|uniref:hypothetical protein n=1 Tax=uncultured Maribacter sp. TaxID=431308 RepID=UPI0026249675|nr:hypothetical protein [uncultured Maribacter sp.]
MKKNLLLYILLGFLVLMNAFFLFKHFSSTDINGPRRPPQGNFIAKQLEFDATQKQKFEKLDKEHREDIKMLLADIRELKDSLFDKLSDETVKSAEIDSIAALIANKEKVKALETFRFFKTVAELCDDNQKDRLRSIIKEALRRQGPPPGRNSPKGKAGDGNRSPRP